MSYGYGDDADQAQLEIDMHLKAQLAKHKANAVKTKENKSTKCIECNIKIPKVRLKALPHTKVCISCAELQEQQIY